MAQERFVVVVSDMRMPGMDGAELVIPVVRHCPNRSRPIRSCHSGRKLITRSTCPAQKRTFDLDHLTIPRLVRAAQTWREPNEPLRDGLVGL